MKTALVVIDMQNDFITGVLGSPSAQAVALRVKEKIREHSESGSHILFTRDTHFGRYLETMEGKHLPVTHCIKESAGWQIADGLVAAAGDAPMRIFNKETFGCLELARFLSTERYDSIELVGLVASICVISNALIIKAHIPDTEIIVDASCTAGLNDEDYRASLSVMKLCHITILNEDSA
jgi:nicotinamidase-related amidase